MARLKTITVKELNGDEYAHLSFIADSQDVESVKEYIGGRAVKKYDAFFVATKDGDYIEIYGIFGTVPHLWKTAHKLK